MYDGTSWGAVSPNESNLVVNQGITWFTNGPNNGTADVNVLKYTSPALAAGTYRVVMQIRTDGTGGATAFARLNNLTSAVLGQVSSSWSNGGNVSYTSFTVTVAATSTLVFSTSYFDGCCGSSLASPSFIRIERL